MYLRDFDCNEITSQTISINNRILHTKWSRSVRSQAYVENMIVVTWVGMVKCPEQWKGLLFINSKSAGWWLRTNEMMTL